MLVTRAYRHKARLTGEQEMLARRFAGCARLIYNSGLEQRRLGYEVTGRGMGYKAQTYGLKDVRADPDFAFLREAPAHVLQQALRDLDRAFKNFFEGRTRYPRPRKRGEHDAFRYPDPDPKQIGVHEPGRIGQVRLPKLGWVSVTNCYPRLKGRGRLFEGELKSVTVAKATAGTCRFAARSSWQTRSRPRAPTSAWTSASPTRSPPRPASCFICRSSASANGRA